MLMNVIAIVGSSKMPYAKCHERIIEILHDEKPTLVISGGASGVDSHAEDISTIKGIKFRRFEPAVNKWENGYKPRNIQIAQSCDVLYNIVLKKNPTDVGSCYHHKSNTHYRSGACWTQKYAESLGKKTVMIEL